MATAEEAADEFVELLDRLKILERALGDLGDEFKSWIERVAARG